MDQIRSIPGIIVRRVNLSAGQVDSFFAKIEQNLSNLNWTQIPTKSDHDYEPSPIISQYFSVFTKSKYRYLNVGITKNSSEGIYFFWEQKLDPRLGKNLGLFTLLVFLVAVLFRSIPPFGSSFPMIFFITGISCVLTFLLRAIYLFERQIERNDEISLIFLDTVLQFEKIPRSDPPTISHILSE